MAIYGGYETVQELSRSGLGSVYSAKKAGSADQAAFAIKTCQPEAAIVGEEAAAAAIARFVEQAETAKAMGEKAGGSGRWAKVYEVGRVEEDGSAFCVTDLGTRGTLERLASGKIQLSSLVLSRIMGEVVNALRDADSALKRGHGNLKPSNVLIGGASGGELTEAKVQLIDPIPARLADIARDRLSDLRAVGAMIHLLVLHAPFRGGWPVEEGPAWKALGRDGVKWRELVNKLLDPNDKADRPSLDELATTIAGLKTLKRSRLPMIIGAAAAVLLIGGGVTAYIATRPVKPPIERTMWNETREASWKQLVNAYNGWYSIFQNALTKPAPAGVGPPGSKTRREAYAAADPQLGQLVNAQGAGEGFDPWSIAEGSEQTVKPAQDLNALSRSPGDYAMGDWGVKRTELALKAIDGLGEGLAAWDAPKKLTASAAEWKKRGWTAAAAYAQQVAEKVNVKPPGNVAETIDNVLIAVPAADRAEQLWTQIQQSAEALKPAKDGVLDKFAGAAGALVNEGQGSGGGGTKQDLDGLVTRLQSVADLGSRLAGFVKTELGTIDVESFTTAKEYATLTSAAPTAETFEAWLKEARKWPSLTEPDPRLALDFDGQHGGLQTQVKNLTSPPLNEKVDAETSARLDKVKPDWEAVDRAKVGWNRRNQQRVEGETARITKELGDLRVALDAKIERRMIVIREGAAGARKKIAERNQIGKGSAAITTAWKGWRDQILTKYPNDEQYEDMAAEADALVAALEQAEKANFGAALPAPEGGAATPAWMAQLNGAVDTEREKQVAAWVSSIGSAPPDVKGEAFAGKAAAAGQAYAAWLVKLVQMRTDLGKVEDLLSQGVAPGGTGDGATAEQLWNKWTTDPLAQDATIKVAISSLSDRIAAAKALAGEKDAAKLVTTITGAAADRPELVIGAWKRLNDAEVGWPKTTAQLGEAKPIKDKIDQVAAGLPAARRGPLKQQVAADLAARWKVFAAGVKDIATLTSAFAAMPDFGVAESDLEPRLKYNLLLSRLKDESRNAKLADEQVVSLINTFTQDVRGLSGGIATTAKPGALLSAMAPIASGDVPKEKPVDPLTLGPGKVWGPQSGQLAGDMLTFQRGGLRLEFIRVDVPGADPVFLCTREMTIADFAEIAAGSPAVAASVPAATSWTGPRGWAKSPGGGITRGHWIVPDAMFSAAKPAYATALLAQGQTAQVSEGAGGEPAADHPMQSVSPVTLAMAARAVGSRFPTEAEWKAAYQRFANGTIPASANLRDATFGTQKQYIAATRPGVVRQDAYQWPDAGYFGVDLPTPPAAGEKAAVGTGNDGVLWFAKESADAGPVHQLVGNVAELFFNNWQQMEGAPVDAGVLGNMLAQGAGVIGGSSLSDPGLGIDRAHPVDFSFAEEGYADVGCRLAFSAKGVAPPRETFVSRLAKLLTDDQYLFP